jgi:hypothetical protein
MVHKSFARGRQRHAPRVTLEEPNLQFIFELFDLVTQAWLRHSQIPACGRKAGAPHNSDKIAYLSDIHDIAPFGPALRQVPTAFEAARRRG